MYRFCHDTQLSLTTSAIQISKQEGGWSTTRPAQSRWRFPIWPENKHSPLLNIRWWAHKVWMFVSNHVFNALCLTGITTRTHLISLEIIIKNSVPLPIPYIVDLPVEKWATVNTHCIPSCVSKKWIHPLYNCAWGVPHQPWKILKEAQSWYDLCVMKRIQHMNIRRYLLLRWFIWHLTN